MFFGRERELSLLESLLEKRVASLVVIRGRRRIGKSTLVEEFAKRSKLPLLSFQGLSPTDETTQQSEREVFVEQMAEQGIIGVAANDWTHIFHHLAQKVKQGRAVVLLDEISWMGSKDPDFLGKLKMTWDVHLKKNPKLIVILCGSVSSWIEEEIIKNSAFLGRISLKLLLEELPLYYCNQFWGRYGKRISNFDKFKFLAITGGVPRYLEELHPNQSAEENIHRLCFQKEGFLFEEFTHIFADIFGRRSDTYEKIVRALVNGSCALADLYKKLKIEKSGKLSEYLDHLVLGGFVTRDRTRVISSAKPSKLSRFRLSDNYLRFYCKWIEPAKDRIEADAYDNVPLTRVSGWDTVMGLQFENLVLRNRKAIHQLLNIAATQILWDNPYFQRFTKTHPGCQIDYLIHTTHSFLYICEVKFSRHPISKSIIGEIQEKMDRLKVPKYLSRVPVLIHVGGVEEEVVESGFFAKIIDFGQLLEIR